MSVSLNEEFVSLGYARQKLIPRAMSGNPISPSTIWRWVNKGLLTPSGGRVKLRVTQVGSRPHTSREAIEEFYTCLTEAKYGNNL
jgi:hypothetical protein